MLASGETLNLLIDLGLTCSQAKAYLALTLLKKAEAKKIAKASGIARQDIYRIMPELEKAGLVEKFLATPILYRAIPLQEGSKKLLDKKTSQCSTLQEKIKLLESYPEQWVEGEEANHFVLTSERGLLQKKIDSEISGAKVDIKAISASDGFKVLLFNHLGAFKAVMKRGVKIRVITEESDFKLSGDEQALCRNSLFEIRYVEAPVPYVFTVFDGKEVSIRVSDATVPSLWTNNPTVVKLAEASFENLWSTASAK
jgi:sugar-specific transcriptional regulator TrmB